MSSTSSAPQVDREEDTHDTIDDDHDSDFSDASHPDADPEYTDRVSSDTSDGASIEKFRESRHRLADEFSRDVIDSNPHPWLNLGRLQSF